MEMRGRLRRTRIGCLAAGFTLLQLCANTTAGLAEGLDLVIDDSGSTTAEIGAGIDLGPLHILAEHKEYLAYLTRSGESAPSDPVARRTSLSASAVFDLGESAEFPLFLSGEHQHFASGQQELDVSLESGLLLPGLQFAARLDMNQEFGSAGDAAQTWEGRLSFGFDWLGGSHQGSLDYDLMPTSRATEIAFGSRWPILDDAEATLDISHSPLDSLSEMEFGLSQRYGPFKVESDFSADSEGDYALGFSLSLSLAPAPAASEWRLSSLFSSLNSTTQQDLVRDSFGITAITASD